MLFSFGRHPTEMILTRCLVLAATALAAAEPPESFVVVKSDGASFHRNTIPQIARTGDGRLFAVWGAHAKNEANGKIYGALSETGGRTWSAPKLLIEDAKLLNGDPNILVDGPKIWVYATRV